mmetsp:Transcript_88268/g.252421  ORF Transcript_88268/g.252421 Transcript_88268/m.252421 type:complete len:82 (-) Transcript_88268:2035-2280(-)
MDEAQATPQEDESTPVAGHMTSRGGGDGDGNGSGNTNNSSMGSSVSKLVVPPKQYHRQASWLEPAEPTEGEEVDAFYIELL